MKKHILIAAAGLAAVALTSCSDSESHNTTTWNSRVYNLVTSLNGAANPYVSQATYSFEFESYSAKAALTSERVQLSADKSISFKAADFDYLSGIYTSIDNGNYVGYEFNVAAPKMEAGQPVTDLKALLTDGFYICPTLIPGLEKVVYSSLYTNMTYKTENCLVRTFAADACFKGTTIATANGATHEPNNDIIYRVVLNLQDASKYTADLYLVNAQFAQGMPKMTIALKGLDLKFVSTGYIISGANVAVSQVADGKLTPVPGFNIDKIEFNVHNDKFGFLRAANGSYELMGGNLKAVFTDGSCNVVGKSDK